MNSLNDAAATLMQRAIKSFTLQDIIKHKDIPYKTFIETCSMYPSKGKNS